MRGQRAFRRHLRRLEPRLEQLRAQGLDSPNVLTLLTVESFYRSGPARLAEYVLWAATSALRRPSVEYLSVGRAQVQLRHWRTLGLLDDTRFSLRRLARVRDLEANYEACLRYLERQGALHEPEPAALARTYAGGVQAALPRSDQSG